MKDLIDLALKEARKEDNRTFLLGAIAIRGDGVLVRSRNGFPPRPEQKAHCEIKILRKAGKKAEIVVIVRWSKLRQELAIAKPCDNCMNALRKAGVRKVIYSIGPDEWKSEWLN